MRFRASERENGFTLIELMIVVLIIAILIAVGIPTFLGARSRSQDRAAQVELRQALVTAKSFYAKDQTYVATAAQLTALEPTVTFDATIGGATRTVVGFTGSATVFTATLQGKNGHWFCLSDSPTTGTTYGPSVGTVLTPSVVQTSADEPSECAAQSW